MILFVFSMVNSNGGKALVCAATWAEETPAASIRSKVISKLRIMNLLYQGLIVLKV
jgi:hypothetical protein